MSPFYCVTHKGVMITRINIIFLLGILSLASCSKVDDYVLGKDNTPAPSPLQPLAKNATHIQEQWSVPVGGSKKNSATNLKLKPVLLNKVVYTAYPNGIVTAVDSTKGKVIWNKTLRQSYRWHFLLRQYWYRLMLVFSTNIHR